MTPQKQKLMMINFIISKNKKIKYNKKKKKKKKKIDQAMD